MNAFCLCKLFKFFTLPCQFCYGLGVKPGLSIGVQESSQFLLEILKERFDGGLVI